MVGIGKRAQKPKSAETAATAPVRHGFGHAERSRRTPSSFRVRLHLLLLLAIFVDATPVAHAGEEDPCLPGVFDPAKGIGAGECYLFEEIKKGLIALNQPSVLQANRLKYGNGEAGLSANFFTINPETKVGINFEADVPLQYGSGGMRAYNATRAYVGAVYRDAHLFDASKPGTAATYAASLGGPIAVSLMTGEKNGFHIAFKADSADKQLFVGMNKASEGLFFFAGPDRKPVTLAAWTTLSYTEYGRKLVGLQDVGSKP